MTPSSVCVFMELGRQNWEKRCLCFGWQQLWSKYMLRQWLLLWGWCISAYFSPVFCGEAGRVGGGGAVFPSAHFIDMEFPFLLVLSPAPHPQKPRSTDYVSPQSRPCQETTELSLWEMNLLWKTVIRIMTFGSASCKGETCHPVQAPFLMEVEQKTQLSQRSREGRI